jgi:hypothetical protein
MARGKKKKGGAVESKPVRSRRESAPAPGRARPPASRFSAFGARSLGFLRVADAVAPTPSPSPPTHQLLDESRLDRKYGAKVSDDSIAKTQRGALVKGVQRGDDASERLDAAVGMATRTDAVGDGILRNLQEQRETILSARVSAEAMEGDMNISERRMRRMACEKFVQKWVLWFVAALFVFGCLFLIYWRVGLGGGARAAAPAAVQRAECVADANGLYPRGCAGDAAGLGLGPGGIARGGDGGGNNNAVVEALREALRRALAPSRSRGDDGGFEGEGGARRGLGGRRALAR